MVAQEARIGSEHGSKRGGNYTSGLENIDPPWCPRKSQMVATFPSDKIPSYLFAPD